MPRIKAESEIETLERQQKELLTKLKHAKAKARAKDKAIQDQKAMVAGRLAVAELTENAAGPLATAFQTVADVKLTRASERALFGLKPHARRPQGRQGTEGVE